MALFGLSIIHYLFIEGQSGPVRNIRNIFKGGSDLSYGNKYLVILRSEHV